MLQTSIPKFMIADINQDPITCKVKKLDYALMFFFLSLCGNIFFESIAPKEVYVLIAVFFFVYYLMNKKRINDGLKNYTYISQAKKLMLFYIIIFIFQFIAFNWNTFPGLINHLSKFIVGLGFILYFGERFRFVLFKTIFIISVISIPLWVIQQYTPLPGLSWSLGKTLWIHCYRDSYDIVRNCGFFWEPGAMGGYIAFLALLYFNDLKELFQFHKIECIIIVLMLLSTQSTGAYVSFGVILISYVAFSMQSKTKYILLPCVLSLSMYVYNNVDFLSNKVNDQNEATSELMWGEYSSNRSGSFYFDLYYIFKHPLIGNGLHERTRFADHIYLAKAMEDGELAYSGNGFSDALAKWGILYPLLFGFIYWRNNTSRPLKKITVLLILSLILQGEMFLNYPLFMVFPFINTKS